MEFLHPNNAEELADIAEETGAEVLRGALRYPSYSGGWQLGDVDLSEHLDQYRDCEIVVIIASTGKAQKERVICGICGSARGDERECPQCKLSNERIARGIRARRDRSEAMFREVDSILDDADE